MSATLPVAGACCPPSCDGVTTQQVPGANGTNGAAGAAGAAGANAFTLFTSIFTIPAELASAVAAVVDTSWMTVNQTVFGARADGSIHAFFLVTAIGGATSVTLKNLEDAGSGTYLENSAPGSTLTVGSKLVPGGIQGPSGSTSGAAAGDLKGTYPAPRISVGNTKGSSLWGNGTDTVAVPAGTNGFMLAYDSTDAEGVKNLKALPVTGDTDLADNRLLRADGATGLPVPAQPSKITVTDNGAIQADGSGGNARGTDANDLQVTRSGATMVASGTNSVIAGGSNNTASGARSTVAGGTGSVASGTESAVGGGNGNTVSATQATCGGGVSNVVRSAASTVAGGSTNTAGDAGAVNLRCTVGGGISNTASGQESTIGGGNANTASATQATIGGGSTNLASGNLSVIAGGIANTASAVESTVSGGQANTASKDFSSIPGGFHATADKYGQQARASGFFAASGDAQVISLIWRIVTTDATVNVEMFLNGSTERALIAVGSSWVFDVLLIGRSSAGVSAAWQVKGAIQNIAGTTALVAAVTTTVLADGTGGTWGVAGSFVVDADNGNDALRLRVTGAGATTIRWVAEARIVEVNH